MKKGFTVGEVLITLVIVGIIATLFLGTVRPNFKEYQNSLGIRKAVKILNDGIALNMAQGERSAFYTTENNTLYDYLQRSLNIISTNVTSAQKTFYTADGMAFGFPSSISDKIILPDGTQLGQKKTYNCGSKGFRLTDEEGSANQAIRNAYPCVIIVDINGDHKPNKLYREGDSALQDRYYFIVTDKMAIPYGEKPRRSAYD